MSPLSPKPCSSRTAGPWPPTRTWTVAPSTGISRTAKLAGNDFTAASVLAGASNESATKAARTERRRMNLFPRMSRHPAARRPSRQDTTASSGGERDGLPEVLNQLGERVLGCRRVVHAQQERGV